MIIEILAALFFFMVFVIPAICFVGWLEKHNKNLGWTFVFVASLYFTAYCVVTSLK